MNMACLLLNDLNVLAISNLYTEAMNGRAPSCRFVVNVHEYNMGYYLVDNIYPNWKVFVKAFTQLEGNKEAHFCKLQKGARKDAE